jgi:hypothetical protein
LRGTSRATPHFRGGPYPTKQLQLANVTLQDLSYVYFASRGIPMDQRVYQRHASLCPSMTDEYALSYLARPTMTAYGRPAKRLGNGGVNPDYPVIGS